ncbi:NapC/NirT family cytochrome c [bacterium]|nr:NapC/NirT family cytochrome c [bacterium]MCI0606491.1 NapC/NirT family cytochrome c [bacterium]
MITPAAILVAIISITIALVGLIVIKPGITVMRVGKILAFLALFIFPVLAVLMGTSEHVQRSKKTQFCLSCHVMEPYGKSLRVDNSEHIPAVHFQNHLVPPESACYTCHTDYTLYGDLNAKLRGLRHVYVYYLGTAPKTIHLYKPYNNRECLHCHLGARSFEEGATHNEEPQRLPNIKTNKLSCMSSGCHEVAHNVDKLNGVTFWKEPSK